MVVFSKFARIQGALKFDFEKELTEVNKVHESCKKEIVYYLSFSISAMTLFFFLETREIAIDAFLSTYPFIL